MEKLTALRVFRRVVERQSFSRAARDLLLSNAAVSKNVRELEAELGAALIQRTTRRLHLTPVGEAYYERAVAVLEALAEADRTVKELSTSPRGLLRVAAPMSLGITMIAPVVGGFLAEHPEIDVELEMNDRIVDIVREGFDVCVRGAGKLHDSSLVARKIAAVDRIVVAAKSYLDRAGEPKTPADLAKHRCLAYSLSSTPTRWGFVKGATKKTISIAGPLRVNNSLGLVQAAVAGAGLAFVPTSTVQREVTERRLVHVLRDWRSEPQTLYAITARHRESSRVVRLFLEHLARSIAPSSH